MSNARSPVSPALDRAAAALLVGAALASLGATFLPGPYYDLIELRLFDIPPGLIPGRETVPRAVTPLQLVEEIVMAAVLFLFAKEGWEAFRCERGPFAGVRAAGPAVLALGAMAGAAAAWALMSWLAEPAEEAAGLHTWAAALAGDAVLAWLAARLIWGGRGIAAQTLLFMGILGMTAGVALGGLIAPGGAGLRPQWLLLPLATALAGWLVLTRPLDDPALSERARAVRHRLWPWVPLAAASWVGVALAGLPPALGFLPVLPALGHARTSFGLFAPAEALLGDPLNRIARPLLAVLPAALFLFGVTHAGMDAGAAAAATWIVPVAMLAGKAAGVLAAAALWAAAGRGPVLANLRRRDLVLLALACGIGLTGPALLLDAALPGGAVREAARIGLMLTLAALPPLALWARRRG